MIYKEHLIEIWVNGQKLELEDQESINIRFNTVLQDPTKISSTQAEYSFSFDVPATPKNNTIFDYANNLDKLNKFHQRFSADVYADGTLIFSGTLIINKYVNKTYNLNLVSVKTYSLEDIFGNSMMCDLDWKIPFSGASTVNSTNGKLNTDVFFPLVSYGVFQKSPETEWGDQRTYTSKFDFDQYNRWYVEDFYPSPRMIDALKKCFEHKGYTVGGDIFANPILDQIYMSTNLADGQSPDYNVGNPLFGKVSFNVSWTSNGVGYVQDLNYPYYPITGYIDLAHSEPVVYEPVFNFESIQVYDMLSGGTVTMSGASYMYQPDEHVIIIPADGFYKIDMIAYAIRLNNATTQMTAKQTVREWNGNIGTLNLSHEEKDIQFYPNFYTTTPLEIALVRNYDDNYELIKGRNNCEIHDGYPEHETEAGREGQPSNYSSYYGCFPHEKLGNMYWLFGMPTKPNDLCNGTDFYVMDSAFGYVPQYNEIMAYDQVVSPCFIAGMTTMGNRNGGGTSAVMKNGYSWSHMSSTKNEAFYKQGGYYKVDISSDWTQITSARTSLNYNEYNYAPSSSIDGNNAYQTGAVHCCVYLNKNDRIQLLGIHRDYETMDSTQVSYSTTVQMNVNIEAISDDTYFNLKQKGFNYNSPIDFDTDLNIGNFFNKEKKMSEWVQNIIDAFNFEVLQNGNTITINTKKKSNTNLITAVDIDNRTYAENAEASMIEYPRSMAVKYKIDGEEWGFERSAVEAAGGEESILDEKDWQKYANSGYTIINLNDDNYVTNTSDKNLQFSYTWYDTFHWYAVNSSFQKTSDTPVDIRIPVISKFSYMIDGYDYEESMKHDGYGLAQRFWFRDTRGTNQYVWTRTYPPEQIFIYEPQPIYTNYRDVYFALSYKLHDGTIDRTLLTEYFNTNAYLSSNYVKLDVYLSPDEYNRIKMGALVRFDSDLYYPIELSAYDPSGTNPTELKLMKKVN